MMLMINGFIKHIQLQNITDETSSVLAAVCILRNYPLSRENTTSQIHYDALIALKEAVINNSCSWVSVLMKY